MSVFIPITRAAALELRSSGSASGLTGYADGPALRRWLGDGRIDDEEATYVALNHAGVAALHLPDPTGRLVMAVDLDLTGADESGAVSVPSLTWTAVRALFADEASAAEALVKARTAVRGLDLAASLADSAVAELQDRHDLLWYSPEELDVLS